MLIHSSANNDETKQDFISKLPDTLLTHILSFLPDADANSTCILSKRWKKLCAFLPNIHFVIPVYSPLELVTKLHDNVDQAFALRNGMPIKKFIVKFKMPPGHINDIDSSLYKKKCDYDRVNDWLRNAVQCKVEEIELKFPSDMYTVKFCWDLFKRCNTLVVLNLEGEFVLNVPKVKKLFPSLRKINLVSVSYSGARSLMNLISGCPVLEELCLERQVSHDNLQNFKVSSTSLKRLKLCFTLDVSWESEVVIDAPKLEYIYIEDYMFTNYSFTGQWSPVEAHINTNNNRFITEFVTHLSALKILTLTSQTVSAFRCDHDFNMPMFPNLVKLVIGIEDAWGWNSVLILLDKMPNLEHITFLDGILPSPHTRYMFHKNWNPPREAPACLRFKVKEIIILNREAITQEEFTLIWYMLNHSNNLDILTVNGHELDPMRLEILLKFHRGSNLCRFEIV